MGEPELWIEPGRFIVGDAGLILTEVTAVKARPKRFVGVDAGMQTLLRPMLYGAYHEIVSADRLAGRRILKQTVVGPICETTDTIAEDRPLPELREGDLLAILDAGAYGFSMSSTYGGRPRPAEVMVRGTKRAIIRKRQTLGDLAIASRIPRLSRE